MSRYAGSPFGWSVVGSPAMKSRVVKPSTREESGDVFGVNQKADGATGAGVVFQNQCQFVHKNLLAGTCPWCGRAIINGQVVNSAPLMTHVRMLKRMLKVTNCRCYAADALGRLGPDAKTAVAALNELLKEEDWQTRYFAALALRQIELTGPEVNAAVSTITELLKDKDCHARYMAEMALGIIGPEAKVPALMELLNDKADMVRMQAAIALGSIGPEAKAAVPALTGMLKDKVDMVRMQAAIALGSIGPEAKAAVPALTGMLKDKNPLVRRVAAEVLVKIKKEKK